MKEIVMRRRSAITDISYTLLDQFNSRNNDLGGYWAMGVLYKHALKHGVLAVSLDLLDGKITPASKACEQIAQVYRTRLKRHLRKRGVPADWVQSAVVNISFNDSADAKPFRSARGDPYVCDVVIKCVSGCVKSSRRTGYCWPHDPKREQKRYSNEALSLGLAGDGDEIDILEDIEATFNVTFTDAEAEACYTVGDVYETLVSKHDFPPKEQVETICASHRAFNQVRAAINTVSSAEVTPGMQMSELGLSDHRGIFDQLRKVERLQVPGFDLVKIGWPILFAIALLVGTSLFFFEWYFVLAVLLLASRWQLIRVPPIEYVGSVEQLVEEIVALNHGYYMDYGAKADHGTVWNSLEAICRQYCGESVERITPSTFVLDR